LGSHDFSRKIKLIDLVNQQAAMKIIVTNEDIEHGTRHDPERCPVARALSRVGVLHFGVMLASVVVADGQGHVTGLPLPGEVTDWILDFDGGRPVAPITFHLAVPSAAKTKAATIDERKGCAEVSALVVNGNSSARWSGLGVDLSKGSRFTKTSGHSDLEAELVGATN
jgi:hypothetical protein